MSTLRKIVSASAKYTLSASRMLSLQAKQQQQPLPKDWQNSAVFNPRVACRSLYPKWAESSDVASIISECKKSRITSHLFVSLIDAIGCDGITVTSPFYQDPAHLRLLQFLCDFSSSLVRDEFSRSTGAATRTIRAPRGIGKSSTLRSFAELSPLLVGDSLIPLYLPFADDDQTYMVESPDDLVTTIAQEVREVRPGFELPADGVWRKGMPREWGFEQALKEEGVYVMLILDEFDQVYRAPPGPHQERALRLLRAVKTLSNTPSMRVAILVTGSSSAMMDLITCKATESSFMRDRFPAVIGAPSLNGHKFRELSLPVPPPTDSTTISKFVSDDFLKNSNRRQLEYDIAYFAGTNARDVTNFLREHRHAYKSDELAVSMASVLLSNAAMNTLHCNRDLILSLFVALQKKNGSLLQSYLNRSSNFPGWSGFVGLTSQEWRALTMQVLGGDANPIDASAKVQFLVDKGWFVFAPKQSEQDLFPVRFHDIEQICAIEDDSARSIKDQIMQFYHGPTGQKIQDRLLDCVFSLRG